MWEICMIYHFVDFFFKGLQAITSVLHSNFNLIRLHHREYRECNIHRIPTIGCGHKLSSILPVPKLDIQSLSHIWLFFVYHIYNYYHKYIKLCNKTGLNTMSIIELCSKWPAFIKLSS